MQVLKFGGSSVANAENIEKVVTIINDSSKNEKTIVVVSALGWNYRYFVRMRFTGLNR